MVRGPLALLFRRAICCGGRRLMFVGQVGLEAAPAARFVHPAGADDDQVL